MSKAAERRLLLEQPGGARVTLVERRSPWDLNTYTIDCDVCGNISTTVSQRGATTTAGAHTRQHLKARRAKREREAQEV